MKLLIVDDSAMIRQAIEAWVDSNNYEIVGTAEDGFQAVELFKSQMPDIVTLDITMPEMSGLEVLDKIKELKPDVKVIIISALTSKQVAIEAIQKGADTFITKPFSQDELLDAFKEVVG